MNTKFSLTLTFSNSFQQNSNGRSFRHIDGSDVRYHGQGAGASKKQDLETTYPANQQTGPPTITNPPVRLAEQSSIDDKPAKKRMQQYTEWDTKENTSSKDGRQKRVDAREEQRAKLQMESAKRDMLVYKQMVNELKTVLETKKDKKVWKALLMEIQANEDIIKTMIRSGVSDVPLPLEIKSQ